MNWTVEPHNWIKIKGIGRDCCNKCGLLLLRNKFTEWCVRMGCDHTDHPQYKYQRDHCRDPR